jgi:hypothetical protein
VNKTSGAEIDRSGPIASRAWLTWRSIVVGAIAAVLVGGIFGINNFGQAAEAIQTRELSVAAAKVALAASRDLARTSELEQPVREAQNKLNKLLQGDRSSCPVPDDRLSSDCYVGLAEELQYAQGILKQAKADADQNALTIEAAQRDLSLAQSDLESFKFYAGMIAILVGIAAGLGGFGVVMVLTWGYWRDRRIARQIVIGSLIATGLGIVVGLIVGFLDYTSPGAEGYSCQARSAAGRGLDCGRNAVIHGERVGLLIAALGIGATTGIVFWNKSRTRRDNPSNSTEQVLPTTNEAPPSTSVEQGTTMAVVVKHQQRDNTTTPATETKPPVQPESPPPARPVRDSPGPLDDPHDKPTTSPKTSTSGGFLDATTDVYARDDGATRSIKRGFNVAGLVWGLLFGFFWPLSHRLWLQALIAFAAIVARIPVGAWVASQVSPENSTNVFLAIFFGIPALVAFWMGMYGNTWRRGRAIKDGYKAPPGAPSGSLALFPGEYVFDGKMRDQ